MLSDALAASEYPNIKSLRTQHIWNLQDAIDCYYNEFRKTEFSRIFI